MQFQKIKNLGKFSDMECQHSGDAQLLTHLKLPRIHLIPLLLILKYGYKSLTAIKAGDMYFLRTLQTLLVDSAPIE